MKYLFINIRTVDHKKYYGLQLPKYLRNCGSTVRRHTKFQIKHRRSKRSTKKLQMNNLVENEIYLDSKNLRVKQQTFAENTESNVNQVPASLSYLKEKAIHPLE